MNNYHYTTAVNLLAIVNEGEIRTSSITHEKRERSAVWLTKSEDWENCFSPGKLNITGKILTRLTLDELKCSIGLCRIKISDNLQTTSFAKFKHVGKVSNAYFEHLRDDLIKDRAKLELWNCSFRNITEQYFDSIEMLVDDEWVKWDGTVSIKEFVDVCHSCNSSDALPEVKIVTPEFYGQMRFYMNKHDEIIEAWEANKDKRGYLEIYVKEDYDTCSIKFIEKGFKDSDFCAAEESDSGHYIYMHLLWYDTYTHYKGAFAYNPQDKKLQMLANTQAA